MISMPSGENPHGGHRFRLRERFIKEGFDAFEEHNILELMLFYAIPQKDTNELAHALLDRFGTLEGVLQADQEELTQVDGVGLQTARFITQAADMTKRYLKSQETNNKLIGMEPIISYALKELSDEDANELLVFLLDNKQALLSWHVFQKHVVTYEKIDNRLLLSLIMGANATYVMVIHKYPRKKTVSKRTDSGIAMKISNLLMTIGVGLSEYIVIGPDNAIEWTLSEGRSD